MPHAVSIQTEGGRFLKVVFMALNFRCLQAQMTSVAGFEALLAERQRPGAVAQAGVPECARAGASGSEAQTPRCGGSGRLNRQTQKPDDHRRAGGWRPVIERLLRCGEER